MKISKKILSIVLTGFFLCSACFQNATAMRNEKKLKLFDYGCALAKKDRKKARKIKDDFEFNDDADISKAINIAFEDGEFSIKEAIVKKKKLKKKLSEFVIRFTYGCALVENDNQSARLIEEKLYSNDNIEKKKEEALNLVFQYGNYHYKEGILDAQGFADLITFYSVELTYGKALAMKHDNVVELIEDSCDLDDEIVFYDCYGKESIGLAFQNGTFEVRRAIINNPKLKELLTDQELKGQILDYVVKLTYGCALAEKDKQSAQLIKNEFDFNDTSDVKKALNLAFQDEDLLIRQGIVANKRLKNFITNFSIKLVYGDFLVNKDDEGIQWIEENFDTIDFNDAFKKEAINLLFQNGNFPIKKSIIDDQELMEKITDFSVDLAYGRARAVNDNRSIELIEEKFDFFNDDADISKAVKLALEHGNGPVKQAIEGSAELKDIISD